MKIHFVRHGETDWNAEGRLQGHSPSRLSEKGRSEAHTLSLRLPHGFKKWPVYVSDLKRTVETADLLHHGHCHKLISSPLLREISLGRWEGKLRSEVQHTEPDLFRTFKHKASQFSIADGESFQQVQRRGLKFIHQILSTENAQEILVVSHRGLIKSVLSYYENRSLDEIWNAPNIPNCSLSTLEVCTDKVKILKYGQVL